MVGGSKGQFLKNVVLRERSALNANICQNIQNYKLCWSKKVQRKNADQICYLCFQNFELYIKITCCLCFNNGIKNAYVWLESLVIINIIVNFQH